MGRREDRPLGRSVMVIPVAVRRRVRPVRALRARRFDARVRCTRNTANRA